MWNINEHVPDHPDIRRAELTGYGAEQDEPAAICSICGREIAEGEDVLDLRRYDWTLGVICDTCVHENKATAYREDF